MRFTSMSLAQTERAPRGALGDLRSETSIAFAALGFGARQTIAAWPVLMGRCLFYVLIMAVFSALWDTVWAERLSGTHLVSLPEGGLAIYVGVTEWITLSIVSVHLRLEDDIRSGALEPHLTRPRSYLTQKVFEAFGGMLVRMAALGATGLTMLALSGRAAPDASAFAGVAVLGVLGGAIGVLIYALVGLFAFWLRRVLPVLMVMQKMMFLFGGLFAPVTLYPDWLERICLITPFAAHIFYAGYMTLESSVELFAQGLGCAVLWLATLAFACASVWRAGLARLLWEGG